MNRIQVKRKEMKRYVYIRYSVIAAFFINTILLLTAYFCFPTDYSSATFFGGAYLTGSAYFNPTWVKIYQLHLYPGIITTITLILSILGIGYLIELSCNPNIRGWKR